MSIIIGIIIGALIGWTFNLIFWRRKKGNWRWTWLLCKPWWLTKNERTELATFYQGEME